MGLTLDLIRNFNLSVNMRVYLQLKFSTNFFIFNLFLFFFYCQYAN